MTTTQYIILSLLVAIIPGISILVYSFLPDRFKKNISVYIFTLLIFFISFSTFYFYYSFLK